MFAQQAPVGHAIERHAARQAEMLFPGQGPRVAGQAQHHFLRHRLNRARDIHVALLDGFLRAAGRPAEQPVKTAVGHGRAAQKIEAVQVHPKGTVGFEVQQFPQDHLRVDRFAVGGQAHEFVFAGIDAKSAVIRERRVKHPQRMRKAQFLQQFNRVAAPAANGRRRPFPHRVDGQNGRLGEGRRIEGAGGVGLVMRREEDRTIRAQARQFLADGFAQVQFPSQPVGNHFRESPPSARRHRQIRFQQAGEFQHRLVIENDAVQVRRLQPAVTQAKLDGLPRKIRLVLDARKPFFLRGGDDLAVAQQRGGGVVVIGGNAQDVQFT
jgi:hypothetical protein